MPKETKKREIITDEQLERVWGGIKAFFEPIRAVFQGLIERSVPLKVFYMALPLLAFVDCGGDLWLFQKLHLKMLATGSREYLAIYVAGVTFLPLYIWGLRKAVRLRELKRILQRDFKETGLETSIGRIPAMVGLHRLDATARKLTIKLNGTAFEELKKRRFDLASRLGVYFTKLQEERTKGLAHITFTTAEIPDYVEFRPEDRAPQQFLVPIGYPEGGKLVQVSLRDVPHFLIGGSTNTGKSTFLRQVITKLYCDNSPNIKFACIDLKEGVEAKLFEGVARFRITREPAEAVDILKRAGEDLRERLAFIEKNNCTNLDELHKLPRDRWVKDTKFGSANVISRYVIVIDEAAELFLAGGRTTLEQASEARKAVATISAQGRAAGVHLIVGTQRPDVNTVDGGIKNNLQGRICFFVGDNASSLTILDSVRGADLNGDIRGRAIYRNGPEMMELQTPYFSREKAAALFDPLRNSKPNVSESAAQGPARSQPAVPTVAIEGSEHDPKIKDDPSRE